MKGKAISLLALVLVAAAGCGAPTTGAAERSADLTEAAAQTEASAEGAATATPEIDADALRAALGGELRTADDTARDAYRHPFETLEFFGISPTSTVVELAPGGGFWTRILGPYLAGGGALVAAGGDPNADSPYAVYARDLAAAIETDRERFATTTYSVFDASAGTGLGEPGSADFVISFRSFHGWHNRGNVETVLRASYEVLKPGGLFGIEQHRAPEGVEDVAEWSKKGYVPQSYVIAAFEAAGFELVGTSEVNANPADTKDHPEGVWSLPPTLRGGDVDKDKYVAIGESDRMTLLFRKPAAE